MKRWIPLAVVFVTIAGLAVWMLTRDSDDLEGAGDSGSRIEDPAVDVATRAPRSPAQNAESPSEDPHPVAAETSEDVRGAETVDDEVTRELPYTIEHLRGRLVVVDADGVESPSESGTMKLSASSASSGGIGVTDTVSIENGAWSLPVRSTLIEHLREMKVREIEVGGRRAVLEGDPYRAVEIRPGEPVVVRARWVEVTLLHVLDASTGVSLDEVEIRERDPRRGGSHEHPGVLHERVLVKSAASPIEVGAGEDRSGRTVFVGRRGYAWSTVALAPTGGERTVSLEPGGSLRIRLDHDGDTPLATLRVYAVTKESSAASAADDIRKRLRQMSPEEVAKNLREIETLRESTAPEGAAMLDGLESVIRGDESAVAVLSLLEMFRGEDVGPPRIEVPVQQRELVEFEGMAPMTYFVRVEFGSWYREPRVLAENVVRVPAGGRGEVTLAWRAPEVPAPATLALSVRCPLAWRDCDAAIDRSLSTVSLERQGVSPTGQDGRHRIRAGEPRREGDELVYRFDPIELEAGAYVAEVGDLEFPARIDVVEGQETVHEIGLPEPAQLVVSVVEKATGDPVLDGEVHWNTLRLIGGGGALQSVSRVPGTNRLEFCVPVGGIEIRHGDRYHGSRMLFVSPGRNEVTFEVRATSKISFVLTHEGTRIRFDSFPKFDVDVLEHGGRVTTWNSSSLRVPSPGLYRITIPQVKGFEPVPPFEVRVAKGEDVEREIELVPVR